MPKTDDPTEERRAQARVLSVQPQREARKKAITLLEEMNGRRLLQPDDQFALGQLYQADGNLAKARDCFRTLANAGKAPNPRFIAYYTQFLLRQREWNEAESYLARLRSVSQTTPGDVGLAELRAQWLEGTNQGKKAVEELTRYVEQSGTRPEKIFALIGLLARQQQYEEALTWCQKARESASPEQVGGATLAVLRSAPADRERWAEVESWLKAESVKNPKSALLYLQLADLCDLRADYRAAEDWSRKAREQDENNLMVLNNLAWRLAQNGKATEGLGLINRAMELAGPQAELLDTRATVHMKMGRPDLAIVDLEAAISDGVVPPARYVRLAEAKLRANNAPEAMVLLQKADKAGLKQQKLHPLEQVAFDKLREELKQR